ncbi:MAG: glucosidase [Candidatus Hydrogenedentes bacterium]|nr:glucosidase [Candidatus Hydrogenedentota bacterium]
MAKSSITAEDRRLREAHARTRNWQRWGPYLSERQWGTVREDYSANGECWEYFPHDHARSRAFRWGEDGLLGITDRECRLCFCLGLWNEKDPILKERLYGLTGPEGNHGEDVKELYYYLDSTPTHSYMKALYKYPQAQFPYAQLLGENQERGRHEREFELLDTGIFDNDHYFDVFAEYAKASPDDILIRVTIANRGDTAAPIHVLPQVWFRNTWSWGCRHEGCWVKPSMRLEDGVVAARHVTFGKYYFFAEAGPGAQPARWLFTENETNARKLFGVDGPRHARDAFHDYVVHDDEDAVNANLTGTKAARHYALEVPAGGEIVLKFRLVAEADAEKNAALGPGFDEVFTQRIKEADAFYAPRLSHIEDNEQRNVARQAYAGLLWSKQFYHYILRDWIEGDPDQPEPPASRLDGRNAEWPHLYARDIISMPDKWEYPWFAAWDLAFHMVPMAVVDPEFAKEQLVLFLREWYMHPNGQLPAYEFAFGDVNPPVHAWACWRVYKMTGPRGQRDTQFLARTFQKLVMNFTWWVNRKDPEGKNIFAGGFLGLDNIGVFDRSKPLPTGGNLEQADGTAWMAFYCSTMLSMALELAQTDPAYEDMASKFFEHFVHITDAMNTLGGTGLWDDEDGFYYDELRLVGRAIPLKVRSLVGVIPLFAVELLEKEVIDQLPGFAKRMNWFLENRKDLARHISYMAEDGHGVDRHKHRLLAIPSRERLERVLKILLDEDEFLAPHGIRALSRVHKDHPYVINVDGEEYRVAYAPGESDTGLFGGNSNWRGPIWFPLNYLLVEALERYHHFYGEDLKVECPTGSGQMMNLQQVANELAMRLTSLFAPADNGRRPCHGDETRYATDPHWKELVLFYEYFHGDTGRGMGASHQTGWTALAARLLNMTASPICEPDRVASKIVRPSG